MNKKNKKQKEERDREEDKEEQEEQREDTLQHVLTCEPTVFLCCLLPALGCARTGCVVDDDRFRAAGPDGAAWCSPSTHNSATSSN